MPTKLCPNCSGHFDIPKNNTKKKFCTQSCAAIYNNARRTNESREKQRNTVTKTCREKFSTKKKLPKVTKPKKKKHIPKYDKFCAILFDKQSTDISIEDKLAFNHYMEYLLWEKLMSPNEIKDMFNFEIANFTDFLKNTAKIEVRTIKTAQLNLNREKRETWDDKEVYYSKCKFSFDVYEFPSIPGYDLLKSNKFFKSKDNKNGITRDHMVSRAYGFKNNIDPYYISHPANCEILFNIDNIKKSSSCSITFDELKERVENWNNKEIKENIISTREHKKLPKTKEHRDLIAESLTGGRFYNNGVNNLYVKPNSSMEIPEGYKRGKCKKIGAGRGI